VGEETRGAKHLLEKIGFTYRNEVDPFDGGPHYSCKLKEVSLVKNGGMKIVQSVSKKLTQDMLIGYEENGQFFCVQTTGQIGGDTVGVNLAGDPELKQFIGKKVFCTPL
jgi:arginine N-succinyltransferase